MSFIYRKTISVVDKFVPPKLQPLWNHPAGNPCTKPVVTVKNEQVIQVSEGPKTIFFWAPGIKWCLVIAGLGDIGRPAEKISLSQSAALSATGLIWARYSLVIIPKNYSLFSVNVFVAITGLYSLSRAINYQYITKPKEAQLKMAT